MLRMERSINQAELGRRSGVSRSRISQLENHWPQGIQYDTVKRLANGLNLKFSHLVELLEDYEGRYAPYHQTSVGQVFPNPKSDKRRLGVNHW